MFNSTESFMEKFDVLKMKRLQDFLQLNVIYNNEKDCCKEKAALLLCVSSCF